MKNIKNNPYIWDNDFENKLKLNSYTYPRKFQDVWEKMSGRNQNQPGFNKFKLIWKTAAAGITGVLAVVFLWIGFSIYAEIPGVINLVNGNVLIRDNPDGKWRKALLNDALRAGNEIQTPNNGICAIEMPGKVLMTVLPSSEMRIDVLQNKFRQVRLHLGKGEIAVKYFHTDGDGDKQYFAIWTSTAEAKVIGTKFLIGINDSGDTRVSVSEGTVSFQPRLESLDKPGLNLDKNTAENLLNCLVQTIPVSSNKSATIPASKVRNLDESLEKTIIALKNENSNIINTGNISGITNRLKQQMMDLNNGIYQGRITDEDLLKLNTVLFETNIALSLSNTNAEEPVGNNGNKNIPPASVFINQNCITENNYYLTERNILKILDFNGRPVHVITVSDSPIMLSKPAFGGKLIYLGSDNGGLYAYSTDGELVWKVMEAGQVKFNAFPVTGKGIVILPTSDKGIEIYTAAGKLSYQIELEKDESIYAAPLFLEEDSILVYGTEKGRIAGYDLSIRKELWSRNDFGDRIIYPLIGAGHTVFVLSRNTGNMQAFNPKAGSIIWQKAFKELQKTDLNPLFTDGKIFAAVNSKSKAVILIIDGGTGNILKRQIYNEPILQPVIWKGKILVYTQSSGSQLINNY